MSHLRRAEANVHGGASLAEDEDEDEDEEEDDYDVESNPMLLPLQGAAAASGGGGGGGGGDDDERGATDSR